MSLYDRKDSPFWWVKITIGGETIQRSTGTEDKILAQEFHDKLKAELWEQKRLGVKPSYSWQQAVMRWLSETSDKKTHDEDISKLKWLDPYLGNLMLHEINKDIIDHVKSEKLKEASKPTVNRYLAVVRAVLYFARDELEWIEKVPKIKVFKENNSRKRSLSIEEMKALLKQLPKHQHETVLFALATGLRQSNVVKMEWAQVNLELRHAHVNDVDSKNGESFGVPLNEIALDVLKRQMGKHQTRVFTYRGKPFKAANTKAWKNALIRAGIENFRWHDLRHTWATFQRQSGTATHELQKLGGWRTAAMVERYAHIAPDHLANAASRIESVFD